jgi:hypothetical protein
VPDVRPIDCKRAWRGGASGTLKDGFQPNSRLIGPRGRIIAAVFGDGSL